MQNAHKNPRHLNIIGLAPTTRSYSSLTESKLSVVGGQLNFASSCRADRSFVHAAEEVSLGNLLLQAQWFVSSYFTEHFSFEIQFVHRHRVRNQGRPPTGSALEIRLDRV